MAINSRLEDLFVGAAGKVLRAVEIQPARSNQHEFNGGAALAALLGQPPEDGTKVYLRTTYVFLDDEMEPVVADSTSTWYEARANTDGRSEFRLYYPANDVMGAATEGDYIVFARPQMGNRERSDLVVVVAPGSSSVAAQLQVLFGLEISDRLDLEMTPMGGDISYTSRQLLEALGFGSPVAPTGLLDQMIDRFGMAFPATSEFSAFARSTVANVDARDDPDAALLAWMDQEESLYRALERALLSEQFVESDGDVDRILQISMQTFQRRRSRAGRALENHVEELLLVHGVQFDSQSKTEGQRRPDFLFPSGRAYADPDYPSHALHILAVKTTCKDRWRQVLSEADRIPTKHLLTLEAPISRAQTDEMRERSLVLVLPRALHDVFENAQQRQLLTVSQFIAAVS